MTARYVNKPIASMVIVSRSPCPENPRREVLRLSCGCIINRAKRPQARRRTVCPYC